MNHYQYPQAPAWSSQNQYAGQQAQNIAPQWTPDQMQYWNMTQQAPAQQNQYYNPRQHWTPQAADGSQQGYWQPQWPAPDVTVNRQTYQAQLAREDGFGQAGFDFSVGGLLLAIFIACFLVWFGWRRKLQAVDAPDGAPVTRNDRRMLSLAEALNKICNKT